ncbi:MAG: LysR family transcriptional regulator [Phenylobacterium sp.]|uniref:LysR family transcriptional regulator n=1 Tax=Phenylobacterium sp. TaxID=1871053 RepID=UPI0025FD227E|nr:LysR family transcriptional regulator [Phenylobacterium sp.]MBI1196556.1 LysR family transcriptional regulator [Phenylobacterium sp.]
MLDDLNELRTFQRILATGSLSAAARELGVGLGVVSKRLQTLERRTGQRLIHRTTRRLSPTAEGLALLAHVDRVLEELAAAEAQLAHGRAEPRGLLRVAAPVSFGRLHVAPVVADLAARHPGLAVDLRLSDEVVDLVDQRIDLAARIGAPPDGRAVARKLLDNRRIMAAAPAYLDARGRPTHPSGLGEGHAFLRYGEGDDPWRLEDGAGAAVEVAAPARLRSANGDVVHDWAMAGHGIMLKSRVDVAADLAAGRLEQVAPGWASGPAPVYAIFPSKAQLPLKTRALLDALVARLAGGF